MSWNLLERFIESEHFNKDPSLAVAYLARYADHVGIQYVLCSKLRHFSYEEIDFFLPQLCHLVVSLDNESMALEEFLIDLCEESVNGALLVWPHSPSFPPFLYLSVFRSLFRSFPLSCSPCLLLPLLTPVCPCACHPQALQC